MVSHIHLDLVGGLSGDMFIGGMLDAFPEYREGLAQVIADAGFPEMVKLARRDHNDGVLTGTQFTVTEAARTSHHGSHAHDHRHYSDIREKLQQSSLDVVTRDHALAIFRLLAEVEAAIHGQQLDDVAFHEVGAWDSIADIVLAAHLIAAVKASSWSISAIPAGKGFVNTAHGRLPVPVPATARLLEGFELVDDGLDGERVTPTGAAIIRFLGPGRRLPTGQVLKSTGYGFGRKTFPGISNMVRIVAFEPLVHGEQAGHGQPWQEDEIMRLSFELDDQTPESIAVALAQLRLEAGVLDVMQQVYWGKKNRQGFSIAVLCRPASADAVTASCFTLTTTLGVRRETIRRATLHREEVVVHVGERAYRVKVSKRPQGYTAKVEMDDVVAAKLSRDQQESVRSQAEALAIRQVTNQPTVNN